MEFHEKLQELRKSRGLTQEELAQELYVSRTAVSKWESGRGYPGIDSLKVISAYFSVTIDDLLSGEKLLSIAEQENKSNIRSICDLLWGMVDIGAFLLIVLPLYPNKTTAYVSSVNLFAYTEMSSFIRLIYWILFITLFCLGGLKIVFTKFGKENSTKIMTEISMGIHILLILVLAGTRVAYALIMAFLLLVIKAVLLFKCIKASGGY